MTDCNHENTVVNRDGPGNSVCYACGSVVTIDPDDPIPTETP